MQPALTISLRSLVLATSGLVLAMGVAVGLVAWVGWHEVVAAAKRIGAGDVAMILATSLACYLIRFLRWHRFTAALGHRLRTFANLHIYIAGLGFTWTPGKAGELLRGVFLARLGVPFTRSVLLFYWDRLSDLAGMLLLALVASVALAAHQLVLLPAAALVVVLLWWLRPGGRPFTKAVALVQARLPEHRRRWSQALIRLADSDARLTPRLAGAGALAGACAYSMQALGLLWVAQAVGVQISFAQALLVMSVSTLAGAAVLLPAGAGVVETASVGLLITQGADAPSAVAIGLIHRATTFWFALMLGAAALGSLISRSAHARAN